MSTFRGRRVVAAGLLAFCALTLAGAAARPAAADDVPAPPDTTTTVAPPDTTTTAPPDTTTTVPAPVEATTTTTVTTVAPAAAPAVVPAAARSTTTTTRRPSTTTTTVAVRVAATTAGATQVPPLTDTNTTNAPDASVTLKIPGTSGAPSQSLMIIVLITLLSVAPALLIMLTSFTRIVIVLSLTRNALGLQSIPPNQVIVGLAMFLSFFVMSPTLSDINTNAVQPLLHGQKTQAQAYDAAVTPLRTFMLKQTRKAELSLFASAAAGGKKPAKPEDVSLAALIPAFILSELKTAFIIGFVIFIPFLVIDIVVSSSLMSMGMMMLPPVLVSLPFKILLFVMVDGWGLIVRSLLKSFG